MFLYISYIVATEDREAKFMMFDERTRILKSLTRNREQITRNSKCQQVKKRTWMKHNS